MRLAETDGVRDSDELVEQVIMGRISPDCWSKLWRASCLRKMAEDLWPFSEASHIVKHEDNLFFWFALKNSRSYAVSSLIGGKIMSYRGRGARMKNEPTFRKRWVLDAAQVQRKILFSEEDSAGRGRAWKMLKSQLESHILSIIISLEGEDRLEAFSIYVSSVPAPMRGEILSAMKRLSPKLAADYQWAQTIKGVILGNDDTPPGTDPKKKNCEVLSPHPERILARLEEAPASRTAKPER
ncbi:MAG: hypothetical protein LBF24_01005 [Puniceicoccales bacterium]|nr:hypothetical protein [Puniceicoccales bacterium]